MKPRLGPQEAAYRFHFSGEERLYADHFGRRVIADVEGAGEFFVETAGATVLTYADEAQTDMFRGSFDRSLTACATRPGEVLVSVRAGGLQPPSAKSESCQGPVMGAGWVVSATGELEIDGRKEPAPLPAPELPIPFYQSAHGDTAFEIVRADVEGRLLDTFSIGDTDALKKRDFKVQNISDVTMLHAFFRNGEEREAPAASHLNAASWTCSVPEGCYGLRLRKIYDRFHGRQRARVLLNGDFKGWWYEPVEDRLTRWGVADFGIPLDGPAGDIRITIDPPPGTPLWSVSEIQVLGLAQLGS